MARIFLTLFLVTASCFAGNDQSIDARIGEWHVRADTAGKQDGSVVTRVSAVRADSGDDARLELSAEAHFILWTHLEKLPGKKMEAGAVKLPAKGDYVTLKAEHAVLITDARAIGLLKLWLDSHRAEWQSDQASGLQEAMRSQLFPPTVLGKQMNDAILSVVGRWLEGGLGVVVRNWLWAR